jgi:hypothetical protein
MGVVTENLELLVSKLIQRMDTFEEAVRLSLDATKTFNDRLAGIEEQVAEILDTFEARTEVTEGQLKLADVLERVGKTIQRALDRPLQ